MIWTYVCVYTKQKLGVNKTRESNESEAMKGINITWERLPSSRVAMDHPLQVWENPSHGSFTLCFWVERETEIMPQAKALFENWKCRKP